MEPTEVMTTKQLADYLQMNYRVVLQKAKRGEIPGRKIGKMWRFSKTAIDEWLRSGGRVHFIQRNLFE